MKIIGFSIAATIMLVLIIPGFISLFTGVDSMPSLSEPLSGITREEDEYQNPQRGADDEKVVVFNPQTENTISLPEYICGVVAAEMPVEYGAEALRAQAVAARTYAKRRIGDAESLTQSDILSIGQAYLSQYELMDIWGDGFEENYAKIEEAVRATDSEVLLYDGELIEAVFHSESCGMTEDAENVWGKEYPYLKSVRSDGDGSVSEKRFENNELIELFRQSFDGINLNDGDFMPQFQIISVTDAGYVGQAQAGSATLTGRQIREALGLKSSAFTVSDEGDYVVFTSKGYGHGVGMSQKGAGRMAENGSGYKEILAHYYSGAIVFEATRYRQTE